MIRIVHKNSKTTATGTNFVKIPFPEVATQEAERHRLSPVISKRFTDIAIRKNHRCQCQQKHQHLNQTATRIPQLLAHEGIREVFQEVRKQHQHRVGNQQQPKSADHIQPSPLSTTGHATAEPQQHSGTQHSQAAAPGQCMTGHPPVHKRAHHAQTRHPVSRECAVQQPIHQHDRPGRKP